MSIHLITDFGLEGPYTGQVLARLYAEAPEIAAFSLLADAPAFDPRHSAYLVAAYGRDVAVGDVLLCVVDPGVGTERAGIVLNADGRWFVGPDNGLLEVAAQQAEKVSWWLLDPPALGTSNTFHGRDWFAPAAAAIASTGDVHGTRCDGPPAGQRGWPTDLAEVVYIDHYGNAMTGLRAREVPVDCDLDIDGTRIGPGRVFAAGAPGQPFWYPNSNGLVEIAVNQGRADAIEGIEVGAVVGCL
jgi:S-adenosyl-L-methionine hydrolase (adenosine-forming)